VKAAISAQVASSDSPGTNSIITTAPAYRLPAVSSTRARNTVTADRYLRMRASNRCSSSSGMVVRRLPSNTGATKTAVNTSTSAAIHS